jgi:hypothetical protein
MAKHGGATTSNDAYLDLYPPDQDAGERLGRALSHLIALLQERQRTDPARLSDPFAK